jgi:hypothetical protein
MLRIKKIEEWQLSALFFVISKKFNVSFVDVTALVSMLSLETKSKSWED